MELQTQSPFPGEPSHIVVARQCGIRRCRTTTPCVNHDQVIVRLIVDGRELPEIKLSKASWKEMSSTFPEPRELFHLLADMVVNASQPQGDLPKMADVAAALS
jgi:hypothetical protein